MTTLTIGERTIVVDGDVVISQKNQLFFLNTTAARQAKELFKGWKGEFRMKSDERGTVFGQHNNNNNLFQVPEATYEGGPRPKIVSL